MTSEDAVPAELRRMWGLTATSRRGRPAGLDVGRVVAAAVELADRDGLAGVTLPKVAEVLGVTTMSLYRYVGSKDELLVLMSDAALGDPPRSGAGLPWREALHQWAEDQLALYARRPWLARALTTASPTGPHQIAWMEAALSALRDTGLDWAYKVGVLNLIGGFVRHAALLSNDLTSSRPELSLAQREYSLALARLVEPDRFPETAKLFDPSVLDARPKSGDNFTLGLELILDGVAAAIARARGKGRRR